MSGTRVFASTFEIPGPSAGLFVDEATVVSILFCTTVIALGRSAYAVCDVFWVTSGRTRGYSFAGMGAGAGAGACCTVRTVYMVKLAIMRSTCS